MRWLPDHTLHRMKRRRRKKMREKEKRKKEAQISKNNRWVTQSIVSPRFSPLKWSPGSFFVYLLWEGEGGVPLFVFEQIPFLFLNRFPSLGASSTCRIPCFQRFLQAPLFNLAAMHSSGFSSSGYLFHSFIAHTKTISHARVCSGGGGGDWRWKWTFVFMPSTMRVETDVR